TLLCITHDVGETPDFDHVVLLERGRIVECGAPALLRHARGARYRALVEAEHAVRVGLWDDPGWRRLRLEDGHISSGASFSREPPVNAANASSALTAGSRGSEAHGHGAVLPAAQDHACP